MLGGLRKLAALRRAPATALLARTALLVQPGAPGLRRRASGGPAAAEPPLKCTIFDAHGRVTAVAALLNRRQFLRDYGLHSRDLRHVDGRSRSLVPLILVRKDNNMLLNICDLRVLIKRDRVLVFHSQDRAIAERLSMLVYDFSEKLGTRARLGGGGQDYEQTALEVVLMHAVAYLEVELNLMLQRVEALFKALDAELTHAKLRDLLECSNALKLFYRKSAAVRKALDDSLDDELGLEDMYLSDSAARPAADAPPPPPPRGPHHAQHAQRAQHAQHGLHRHGPPPADAHTRTHAQAPQRPGANPESNDIEILLESYYSQADELVQKAQRTVNEVAMTEEVMNIIIDSNRNSLLLYRLELSVLTLGVALATVFADLYGMNLENYIEDTNWSMAAISGTTIFLAYFGSLLGFRRLRHTRRVFMPHSAHVDPKPRLRRETLRNWLLHSK